MSDHPMVLAAAVKSDLAAHFQSAGPSSSFRAGRDTVLGEKAIRMKHPEFPGRLSRSRSPRRREERKGHGDQGYFYASFATSRCRLPVSLEREAVTLDRRIIAPSVVPPSTGGRSIPPRQRGGRGRGSSFDGPISVLTAESSGCFMPYRPTEIRIIRTSRDARTA